MNNTIVLDYIRATTNLYASCEEWDRQLKGLEDVIEDFHSGAKATLDRRMHVLYDDNCGADSGCVSIEYDSGV